MKRKSNTWSRIVEKLDAFSKPLPKDLPGERYSSCTGVFLTIFMYLFTATCIVFIGIILLEIDLFNDIEIEDVEDLISLDEDVILLEEIEEIVDVKLSNFAWGVVDLRNNDFTELAPEIGAFKAISRKKDA